MATYTTYLNLEKPTTSETFNLLKMNQNWDKIDQGVSSLNSKFPTVSTPVSSTSCSFTTNYGYLGVSFTLTKPSLVRIDASYTNSLPIKLGCKSSTSASSNSLLYAENSEETEQVGSVSASGFLGAGTYYIWGCAKGAGNNNISVYTYS